MSGHPPWIPRRYEPGDETKIDNLLRRCLGDGYPGLEYWWWVFKRNPLGFHGAEGDIWVAETSAGNLIGYCGRIRVPMWFTGTAIVGSQVAMLATHPDHRRRGVYETLARVPDPKAFLQRMRRSPVTKWFASMLLSYGGPKAYLEWRYHRTWGDYQILSAVREGQTIGYVVFRAAPALSERGRICELISMDDDIHVYRELLKEVCRRSRDQGMIALAASPACSPGHHAALRGTRVRLIASIMKSVRYRGGHLVALFLQAGRRDHPQGLRWYHSIGDRDFG